MSGRRSPVGLPGLAGRGRCLSHTGGRHILLEGGRSSDIRVQDIIVLDSPSDVTFKDIEVYGTQRIPSLIMGHDPNHPVRDIRFDHVVIRGRDITDPRPGEFIVDQETTSNITLR